MKQNIIDEVNYQKKMLSNLQRWLRNSMIISSLAVALIVFGNTFPILLKVIVGIVLACSIVASMLIGLAIKNGRENVNKIIKSI